MASKIKVDQLEGSTGSTITIPTGQTFTVTDGIPVASGGTGLASFTAGDILYATGETTLTKLNKGTAEQVLAMNSGATAPDWGSVDLTVLPTITVAKGGTNLASFTAGDILYATGTTTLAKLAKGTASQALQMNAGATAPEWVTASGGGFVKLATTTLSGTSAGIAFDNTYITSTYDNYYVTVNGLYPTTDNADIGIFLSVDNGSNFATHTSGNRYSQLNGTGDGWQHSIPQHTIAHDCSSATGEMAVSGWAIIQNVNSTTAWKSIFGNGMTQNSGTKTHDYAYHTSTMFESTSAVDYMIIKANSGNLAAVGSATLYGMVK